MNMDTKATLSGIVSWLNENYNQDSPKYNIFVGSKPEVIKYDDHTAISLWSCGAIVCIGSILYFIEEDDGNWTMTENEDGSWYGLQSSFSIGWAKSFADALTRLIDYTKENGEPVYFSGTDVLCHYSL